VREVLEGASAALYFSIVQIPQINTQKRLAYEVNVLGLQNVCEAAFQSTTVKGLVHSGTWHVFGERGLNGIVDESYGLRPDRVEDRARLYALSKVIQEAVVRFYDEMATGSGKTFGVIRMGTVLGAGMPETTAANLFIRNGLAGQPLTPFRHSMHRPMLYVDIRDVCEAYASYVKKTINADTAADGGSLGHVVNLFWPKPITILELAEIVQAEISQTTRGTIQPQIKIEDKGLPELFGEKDKTMFAVDGAKAATFLGLKNLISPQESLRTLVAHYMGS
jgi:UDP-glucose 4-epimerase